MAHPSNATEFQKACFAAQHANDKFGEYLQQIERADADPRYTRENIREHVAAFESTPAFRDAEQRATAFEGQVTLAKQVVEAARASLSVRGDAATEERNTRYWNRVVRQLDSIQDGAYVHPINQFIADADQEQLSVLVDELEPYLKSRGVDVGWLEDQFAAAAPVYGEAKKALAVAEQGNLVARTNINRLRDSIAGSNLSGVQLQPHLVPYDSRYDPGM